MKDKRLLEVLRHLKRANVDYGKSIMLNTKIPLTEVLDVLDKLESLGLIERVTGATLKNTEAKFKLSQEVHKHHTYYRLTRDGDHLLRRLDEKDIIDAYAEIVKDDEVGLKLLYYAEELHSDHALTYSKLLRKPLEEITPKIEELERMGLMEEKNSKVIKFRERRAKPKKETRTHHKYYGLTRLGELLVRELKRRGVLEK
ncbi:hypothetical protein SacN8_08935 [Sulfolobus acidocaldarius N8]|uniref:DUF2250 domain-containing protein n=2 Tax=Sulfolobus acidocaldarius TaxID=2285 RepID=M1JEE0_9CREN|nr:hypothetical protein SacN8_08935 [Sulfolobus acidocaldarius N8]AGE74020.1 hypothetical protein SacRon12I_08945 [Sulfolobus acidocaldarius Ron12/I]WCM36066.1 DUF2250 domain-containing protein [Sulfolobus acidocaldarius DSM 639]